ncbi:MAG: hypothetical protein ABEJ44_01045 [Halanaeroarchaeum sp.]
MGFSVSASTAVILVAAFASFGLLYTSAYNGFENVSEATTIKHELALETQNSDITIRNVSHNTSGTTDYVNVTVENTGSTTLHVSDTSVLLNGTLRMSSITYSISSTDGTVRAGENGTDLWLPAENLTISVHQNVDEPFRVKIVTDNGIAATAVKS